MVSYKEITYKNYGKCLEITNGAVEVCVTVDVGPRIIKCCLAGRENLMHNDDERKSFKDVGRMFGEGATWFIYGGHRMWISPESFPASYYPDNSKVVYALTPSGASFTPPPQRQTGWQTEIEIKMDGEKPEFDVIHRLTNAGDSEATGAIWALSVMAEGGVAVLPQPAEDTGLLGNRILALWPYTDMADKRVMWGKDYIAVRQDPAVPESFKFGINNTKGAIAYVNRGQALVKTFETSHGRERYPDFGVSCEVFTNGLFIEAESIAPLRIMEPGGLAEHTERWRLVPDIAVPALDEGEIRALSTLLMI